MCCLWTEHWQPGNFLLLKVLRWQCMGQIYSTSHDPWNTALKTIGFFAITKSVLTIYLRFRAPRPILIDGPLFIISLSFNKPFLSTLQLNLETKQWVFFTQCTKVNWTTPSIYDQYYLLSVVCVTRMSPVNGNCSDITTYLLIILRLHDVKEKQVLEVRTITCSAFVGADWDIMSEDFGLFSIWHVFLLCL